MERKGVFADVLISRSFISSIILSLGPKEKKKIFFYERLFHRIFDFLECILDTARETIFVGAVFLKFLTLFIEFRFEIYISLEFSEKHMLFCLFSMELPMGSFTRLALGYANTSRAGSEEYAEQNE